MRRSRRVRASLAVGGAILAIALAAPPAYPQLGRSPAGGRDERGPGPDGLRLVRQREPRDAGSTPGVDDDDPTWTQGILGADALAFDNEDIVTIPRDPSLELDA